MAVIRLLDENPYVPLTSTIDSDALPLDRASRIKAKAHTGELLIILHLEVQRLTNANPFFPRKERHLPGDKGEDKLTLVICELGETTAWDHVNRTVTKVLSDNPGTGHAVSVFIVDMPTDLSLPNH